MNIYGVKILDTLLFYFNFLTQIQAGIHFKFEAFLAHHQRFYYDSIIDWKLCGALSIKQQYSV